MKGLRKAWLPGLLVPIMWTLVAQAADLTFTWDANTEPDLAGYHIYMATKTGQISTAWSRIGSPTTNTFTYTVADDKGYAFCATAYDTGGLESFVSNIALYNWGMNPPVNFNFTAK